MRSVAWFVLGFLTAVVVAVIVSFVLLNKTVHGIPSRVRNSF
jgi:hypothetical protein